jgi:carbon dioxide concentrating mechanism protein CcmM
MSKKEESVRLMNNQQEHFLPESKKNPQISKSASIRNSQITGDVIIEDNVHIANAVLRADEGTPFYIGRNSNIQDFVTLHAYTTQEGSNRLYNKLIEVNDSHYAIYIDEEVSLSHGVLVHGPSFVGRNTFVGFKSTLDGANLGQNVEVGAHSYIKDVTIPDNTAIVPGAVITHSDDIKKFTTTPVGINMRIAEVNKQLARRYVSCKEY